MRLWESSESESDMKQRVDGRKGLLCNAIKVSNREGPSLMLLVEIRNGESAAMCYGPPSSSLVPRASCVQSTIDDWQIHSSRNNSKLFKRRSIVNSFRVAEH